MKALAESWKTLKLMRSLSDFKSSEDGSLDQARQKLIESFSDKNGLQFKIGQYFDLGKDVEGLSLRDFALIPVDEVQSILKKEWGEEVLSEFEIDWDHVKSASMGQVHLAKHVSSGREVIIKVLYPEIKQTIVNQIKGLEIASFIPNAFMSKKYQMQMNDYLEKLKQILDKECDLRNEFEACQKLREGLRELPWVRVPKVLDQYTTSNVLVQEFDDGMDYDSFLAESTPELQRLTGEKLIQTFLHQIFVTGYLQGDTNKGNFLFHPSADRPEITQIDYGNFINLDDKFKKNLFSLLHGIISGQDIDPFPYLVGMGFDSEKLSHFHKTLPLLVQKLFAPFLSAIPFDLDRWKLSRDVDMVLGEYKWWFRSAGGLEFFQLMKSMKGLFGMLQKTEVNFNWGHLFKSIAEQEKGNLLIHHLPSSMDFKFNSLAKSVKIHVFEKGSEKVSLTLPASSLINLKDLMEPNLIQSLEKQGIDIDYLIRRAIRKGGYPETLFEFKDQDKSVQVILE